MITGVEEKSVAKSIDRQELRQVLHTVGSRCNLKWITRSRVRGLDPSPKQR